MPMISFGVNLNVSSQFSRQEICERQCHSCQYYNTADTIGHAKNDKVNGPQNAGYGKKISQNLSPASVCQALLQVTWPI